MAADSAPWMSVSPVARRAATLKAMAMRWSPPESIVAPWRVWPPGTSRPSSNSVDFSAHGAEIFGDEGDAVGLLDAEFLRVADANAAAGEGRDGGEDGQLVDELSGERAADFG